MLITWHRGRHIVYIRLYVVELHLDRNTLLRIVVIISSFFSCQFIIFSLFSPLLPSTTPLCFRLKTHLFHKFTLDCWYPLWNRFSELSSYNLIEFQADCGVSYHHQTVSYSGLYKNKCIGDDTKAAARQRKQKKIKYGEKRFSIWRMEFLHPAM